jgi:hypothetical protein
MGEMTLNISDAALRSLNERARREGKTVEELAAQLVALGSLESKRPSKSVLDALDRLRALTPRKLESSAPLLREARERGFADD